MAPIKLHIIGIQNFDSLKKDMFTYLNVPDESIKRLPDLTGNNAIDVMGIVNQLKKLICPNRVVTGHRLAPGRPSSCKRAFAQDIQGSSTQIPGILPIK